MLCCGAEIGMFVFGIIALVKGSFTLSTNRVVQGAPARIVGGILLLPLLVGQGGAMIMGAMWGIEREMQGRPLDFAAAVREVPQDLQNKILILHAIAIVVSFITVLVVSLLNASVKKKRRRDKDLDDDDDRPRRRRERADYDDEDDRPRRRRERDDDEDDRPRRRRERDEEDDDRPPRRGEPPDERYEDRSRRRRESRDED